MGQQCEQLRQEGFNIGYDKGISVGAKKAALEHIIRMLEIDADIDLISRVTKKSKEEILAIKKEHNL